MVSCNDNYPMGTWGGDPRAPWNQPDPPECLKCYEALREDWEYCPWCGERIDWQAIEDATYEGGPWR